MSNTTDTTSTDTISADAISAAGPPRPVLRVVNPDATPEEIAAIITVFTTLAALSGGDGPAPKTALSLWSAPRPRITPHHGPAAWRTSALPH